MLRRLALCLTLAVSGLTATPALAWSPVSIHVNIGGPVAALAPLAVGGMVVAPRVLFYPDGRIAFGAYATIGAVPVAPYERMHELLLYEPDGAVRTVVVRDRDRPVFERFLIAHHEPFAWRRWQRRSAFVERPESPGPGFWRDREEGHQRDRQEGYQRDRQEGYRRDDHGGGGPRWGHDQGFRRDRGD